MSGIAQSIANGMIPESEAQKITSDDVDGELEIDEREKIYHGQASVWVFIEYIHTTTASEWWFDKRGEFFVLVNNVRFPSQGEIFMEKDNQWTCPRPRAIYSEFMKNDKAKCELTIEVRERDLIRDDRLMKFQLSQPFLPGTYRKVITLASSPIILSLIVKLEKNIFVSMARVSKPIFAASKKAKSQANLTRKKPGELTKSSAVLAALKDVGEEPPSPRTAFTTSSGSVSNDDDDVVRHASGGHALPQPPPQRQQSSGHVLPQPPPISPRPVSEPL